MSSYKQMEFDLRLSRAASLARTYPQQEKEPELFTGIDPLSGKRCYDSPEMYTQRGLLRKMYQPCDLKGLPWSYKISARSGMWENFIVYPLVPVAALRIKGTESGSWPTPRASNPGSRPNGKGGKVLAEEVLIAEGLRKRGEKLMWPTPTTSPSRPNEGNVCLLRKKVEAGELSAEIASVMLNGKSVFSAQGRLMEKGSNHSARVSPTSGTLNPRWVEWLQGYPDGWTDLSSLETP